MDYLNYIDKLSVACSKTGKNNLERGAECEDVIYIDKTSKIKFFGIADGQSRKKYCREGGKEVLKAVFGFIARKGIDRMTQYEHMDELQYELIRVIRDTVSELASNNGAEKSEFASTLVVLAYDIHTGNYMIVHLGDGSIIGRKKDGDISMISSPENGLTTNYTWLTTSQEALYHLRIGFGNINNYSRIIMITDGAIMYAHGRNISERAKILIESGNREDLISFLDNSDPSDDASCIIIDFMQFAVQYGSRRTT